MKKKNIIFLLLLVCIVLVFFVSQRNEIKVNGSETPLSHELYDDTRTPEYVRVYNMISDVNKKNGTTNIAQGMSVEEAEKMNSGLIFSATCTPFQP